MFLIVVFISFKSRQFKYIYDCENINKYQNKKIRASGFTRVKFNT